MQISLTKTVGMTQLLADTAKKDVPVDSSTLAKWTGVLGTKTTGDHVQVWRAVGAEDGCEAWLRLCGHGQTPSKELCGDEGTFDRIGTSHEDGAGSDRARHIRHARPIGPDRDLGSPDAAAHCLHAIGPI